MAKKNKSPNYPNKSPKLLIYLLFSIVLKQCQNQDNISNIQLKLQGKGVINLFSYNFEYMPNKIVINGEDLSSIESKYNFSNSENDIYDVVLIWYSYLNSTKEMFKGCSNIIEIDFSEFIADRIINMEKMFSGCSSLQYLDLSNINILNVENSENIFSECSSLKYINIKSAKLNEEIKKQIIGINSLEIIYNNEEDFFLNEFSDNENIICYEENEAINDNINENKHNCLIKSESTIKNLCRICGQNLFEFFIDDNSDIIMNQ